MKKTAHRFSSFTSQGRWQERIAVRFVPEFERLLRLHGKPRVLFDMTGFHGWDAGAAWEDLRFDMKTLRRHRTAGDRRG